MNWGEIHRLDQDITLAINSLDSSISNPIWQFFSNIPVWAPMYLLIIGCLIWRLGWKKGMIMTAAALLTFGFCDQLSNLIKDLVARVRPLNDAYMLEHGLNVLEKGSKSFSFFSAHAANAFGLSTSTYIGFRLDSRLKYRGYAAWMYTWASLVAISRVFVGKHYLGDVLAGAAIGAIAGLTFAYIARLLCRQIDKNKRG